jgi:prepilin-type N-terminal cleavage/methylation domain-containing protein
MNHAAKQRGFTLIELMLAMAFISVLLLAVALTIIQVGIIYNRGMTLKEVNQSARSVTDEITRQVSSSTSFNLSTKYVTNSAGGRLCLGQDTFIWNLGKAITSGDSNMTRYNAASAKRNQTIRFIKVPDAAGLYCLMTNGNFTHRDIRVADTNLTTDLLRAGDRELTLHQFDMRQGSNVKDSATGQQLYTLLFTIGTGKTTALTADQSACLPPGDPNSDFSYCTVQQFTLVLRAGGQVN